MINHPNRKKVYPNTVLADRARAADFHCRLMWEIPGPKDSQIAWLSCYQIGLSLCIVETFKGENGWNAFTPARTNNIDETIADVLARCDVLPAAA